MSRFRLIPLGVLVLLVSTANANLPDDRDARNEYRPIISGAFLLRSSFKTDEDYSKYIQKTIRIGSRVRCLVDYESVKKGMLGTYYGTNDGQPPCSVVWDKDIMSGSTRLPNVPADKASHVYWVYWHQVEIVELHR